MIKLKYDMEIDLHGLTAEEAIRKIESVLYSLPRPFSILIIHGRGRGILKGAVRDFLRYNTYVGSYHYGEDLNLPGSDGVTIIYL